MVASRVVLFLRRGASLGRERRLWCGRPPETRGPHATPGGATRARGSGRSSRARRGGGGDASCALRAPWRRAAAVVRPPTVCGVGPRRAAHERVADLGAPRGRVTAGRRQRRRTAQPRARLARGRVASVHGGSDLGRVQIDWSIAVSSQSHAGLAGHPRKLAHERAWACVIRSAVVTSNELVPRRLLCTRRGTKRVNRQGVEAPTVVPCSTRSVCGSSSARIEAAVASMGWAAGAGQDRRREAPPDVGEDGSSRGDFQRI